MRLLLVLLTFFTSLQLYEQRSAAADKQVYICVSATAYAYHDNLNCRGLRSCTHKIDTVDISTAKAKYKRKPCGYCY